MKILIVILSTAALALAATSAIALDRRADAPSTTAATAQKYTCEMHPEVISDKPGKCPKCGMNLVPVQPQPSPKK